MKRLKVVLAFALALAMMVTISVAPALANNNNNNNDNRLDRKDIQLDRKILNELRDDNNFGCCGFNNFGFNDFDHHCCGFDNDDHFTSFNIFNDDCEWELEDEDELFWVDGHWQWGIWVLDC
jgi:hypothetical protein